MFNGGLVARSRIDPIPTDYLISTVSIKPLNSDKVSRYNGRLTERLQLFVNNSIRKAAFLFQVLGEILTNLASNGVLK